jgi:hypothetical protein
MPKLTGTESVRKWVLEMSKNGCYADEHFIAGFAYLYNIQVYVWPADHYLPNQDFTNPSLFSPPHFEKTIHLLIYGNLRNDGHYDPGILVPKLGPLSMNKFNDLSKVKNPSSIRSETNSNVYPSQVFFNS